jgi:hypothetical protein
VAQDVLALPSARARSTSASFSSLSPSGSKVEMVAMLGAEGEATTSAAAVSVGSPATGAPAAGSVAGSVGSPVVVGTTSPPP